MPLAIPYCQLPSMVWIRLSSSSTFDDCNGLNCFVSPHHKMDPGRSCDDIRIGACCRNFGTR